jgi:hypothetical protein
MSHLIRQIIDNSKLTFTFSKDNDPLMSNDHQKLIDSCKCILSYVKSDTIWKQPELLIFIMEFLQKSSYLMKIHINESK